MLYVGTALGTAGFARLAGVGVSVGLLAPLTLAFDRVQGQAAPSGYSAI